MASPTVFAIITRGSPSATNRAKDLRSWVQTSSPRTTTAIFALRWPRRSRTTAALFRPQLRRGDHRFAIKHRKRSDLRAGIELLASLDNGIDHFGNERAIPILDHDVVPPSHDAVASSVVEANRSGGERRSHPRILLSKRSRVSQGCNRRQEHGFELVTTPT